MPIEQVREHVHVKTLIYKGLNLLNPLSTLKSEVSPGSASSPRFTGESMAVTLNLLNLLNLYKSKLIEQVRKGAQNGRFALHRLRSRTTRSD